LGGEERTFRLAIGQWRRVQEKCDAGPPELLARLSPIYNARRAGLTFGQIMAQGYLGTWRIDDVREVIFQGLLGGGTTPNEAAALVKTWVEERPLFEPLDVAYQVVLASIAGAPDEDASGESEAAAEGSQTSPAASSGLEKTASTPRPAGSTGALEPSMT
jgi:hypothetical protein